MTQQGQIGGPRDINALRQACANSAFSFSQGDAQYLSLTAAFTGYTQTDFEAMGFSTDDAYYLADQLPKIRTVLESSADWELVRNFATRTKDITRIM